MPHDRCRPAARPAPFIFPQISAGVSRARGEGAAAP